MGVSPRGLPCCAGAAGWWRWRGALRGRGREVARGVDSPRACQARPAARMLLRAHELHRGQMTSGKDRPSYPVLAPSAPIWPNKGRGVARAGNRCAARKNPDGSWGISPWFHRLCAGGASLAPGASPTPGNGSEGLLHPRPCALVGPGVLRARYASLVTGRPVAATRSIRFAARTVPGLALRRAEMASSRRRSVRSASSSSMASVSSSSRKS